MFGQHILHNKLEITAWKTMQEVQKLIFVVEIWTFQETKKQLFLTAWWLYKAVAPGKSWGCSLSLSLVLKLEPELGKSVYRLNWEAIKTVTQWWLSRYNQLCSLHFYSFNFMFLIGWINNMFFRYWSLNDW